jgi:hypothetical protein
MRIVVVALIATGLAALAFRPQRDPLPEFPRIIIWAWTDLSSCGPFIPTAAFGFWKMPEDPSGRFAIA